MSAVLGLAPEQVREICAVGRGGDGRSRLARELQRARSRPSSPARPARWSVPGRSSRRRARGGSCRSPCPPPSTAPSWRRSAGAPRAGAAGRSPGRRRRVPVVTNVEAKPNSDAARIVPLLLEQVTAPVRWIECVEELVRLGRDPDGRGGPREGALAASRSASTSPSRCGTWKTAPLSRRPSPPSGGRRPPWRSTSRGRPRSSPARRAASGAPSRWRSRAAGRRVALNYAGNEAAANEAPRPGAAGGRREGEALPVRRRRPGRLRGGRRGGRSPTSAGCTSS